MAGRPNKGGRSGIAVICCQCSRPVSPGSGLFADRMSEANDENTGMDMGRPYPWGDYLCAQCDAAMPFVGEEPA
jgi:hypothetical protein